MARMPDFEPPEPEPAPDLERPGGGSESASHAAAAGDLGAPRGTAPEEGGSAGAARRDGPIARLVLAVRRGWRRARVPAIAFVAGAAVAATAAIATDVVRDRDDRDDVVAALDAYVAAVESRVDRDAATVLATSLDQAVASSELLTLDPPAVEAPTVRCDEPRIGGDLARVDCRVRVERRTESAEVLLERRGDDWTIVQGLEVPVRIQSGALLVDAIAGVPVDDAVARGERAVWLLPGRYDVAVRTPAQLAIERLDGLVVSTTGGTVRWSGDAAATVEADVRAAALAFVEGCVVAPVEGCPALQPRDPAERFEAFAVVGRLALDDRYAMTYEVSLRRPVEEPREYLVVTVRVDFGEELDRYEIAIA
ncbi:hypothetical protein [Agrococcus sp. SGAir0287]|uniref:hypothetical protein n=1 Tax=Agrococcus sp. SGAir0287 TaxID=2070347 RepID=UPI0010F4DD8A|nr:hypothetical protein [Agrococcus sp. SGAir0287]